VNDASKALIASSGGTVLILDAMRENQTHKDIQLDGCVSLWNLIDNPRGKKDALSAGARFIVDKAVENFPESEQIQTFGTQLLRMYHDRKEAGMCSAFLACALLDDVGETLCH
jgi:hypothetical protein